MDDLLSADNLALQTLMVHFLTERAVTRDSIRRIGTEFSEEHLNEHTHACALA